MSGSGEASRPPCCRRKAKKQDDPSKGKSRLPPGAVSRVMYATYQSRRVAHMLSTVLRFISIIGLFCLPAIATAQQPIPDDLVISLQRGNCEGGCPVYRVLIFANGDVIWQGRGRVARPGVALSAVERGSDPRPDPGLRIDRLFPSRRISTAFAATDADRRRRACPWSITSLSMGGASRILSHFNGCAAKFRTGLQPSRTP